MALTDYEIERLAQLIFEKIVHKQNEFEKNNNSYIIHDEFGNATSVTEQEFFVFELERLTELEKKYVQEEQYEKADFIKNKILRIKLKLSKL